MAAPHERASPQRRGQGRIEALGGWEKIMEALQERLAEQKGRHAGGSKWIGTGGTSPFGAYGYNPAGVRIGQKESRATGARSRCGTSASTGISTTTVELGTRNIKVALRRLRSLRARRRRPTSSTSTAPSRGTAQKGYLDIHMRAGAAQRGEGADVLRRRRLDGLAHQGRRGAVLGGAHRVQAPRVFLLPQLPLRARLARQRAPPQRARHRPGTCCTPTRPTTR